MSASYIRYLKVTYEKASAAWRREQRKRPQPCSICGNADSEVMPEGNWLCREHKAVWKSIMPYKSHAQRLTEMGITFLTEEQRAAGMLEAKKKRKRQPSTLEVKSWDYSAGRSTPAKKTPVRKKK